jgi:hypothetical protein
VSRIRVAVVLYLVVLLRVLSLHLFFVFDAHGV